jgi:uracil-DNA glycosylase family 4
MEIIDLFNEARQCKRCYGERPIFVPCPDPKNGFKNVKIMFINERPGRIGTGESGYVSFDNNDPTARQFKKNFQLLGISRKNIFITNACICHPKNDKYVDTSPTTEQLKNCHYWLKEQIGLVNPEIIVTIGNIALKSLKLLFSDSKQLKHFILKRDVGKVIKDTQPWIYPLYHTSRRARLARNAEQQEKDWLKIKDILKKLVK